MNGIRTEKRKIGDFGETITCQFLMKHGFTIIERNYLKPWGEIDVIARKDKLVHFIEVKSVVRDNFVSVTHETDEYRPEDNVHEAKLKRLARTMQTYLLEKGIDNDWQFDVAVVYIEKGLKRAKVRLLSNIVL
jgi:putative endonuclease